MRHAGTLFILYDFMAKIRIFPAHSKKKRDALQHI